MPFAFHTFETALRLLTSLGSLLWCAIAVSAVAFAWRRSRRRTAADAVAWPSVTLLKPVCGLEKQLAENLRSACLQDYPRYQVIYSVQRASDPALPLLYSLRQELDSERVQVTVVVDEAEVGLNGKINNLSNALPYAQHDVLVISDSDVRLQPDYLKTIVAPLSDPAVGGVSTFFKASDAGPWYEQLELLTINADHFAVAQLAYMLKLVDFCFGASFATRRELLTRIGGLAALGDYLVEDHELGQRLLRAEQKLVVVPYVVETMVDLKGPSHWWQKQTYWDQNTKAAIPLVFAATFVLRVVPLALLFALLRGFDRTAVATLLAAIAVRLTSAAVVLGLALRDPNSLRALWLIPLKDVLSLVWFVRAFLQRTVSWRGVEMTLTRDGKLRPLRSERAA